MKKAAKSVVKEHYKSLIDLDSQTRGEVQNQDGEYLVIREQVQSALSNGGFLWGPPDPQTVRILSNEQLIFAALLMRTSGTVGEHGTSCH